LFGPLSRLLHPIQAWRSGKLRRNADRLAEEIEAFLEERDKGHPPPNRAEQDSPEWKAAQARKRDYGQETVRLFSERGHRQRVLDFAQTLEIEGARYTFAPPKPDTTSAIRKLPEELRHIGRLKRLVR